MDTCEEEVAPLAIKCALQEPHVSGQTSPPAEPEPRVTSPEVGCEGHKESWLFEQI